MKAIHWCLLVFLAVVLGCGGGGGVVVPTTVAVQGNILWIETGGATSPATNVRISTASTTTDLVDGYFSMDVPFGSTEMTLTFIPSGSTTPIVRTFLFSPLAADRDFGEIYIGPEEVTVSGQLVDSTTNLGVGGATVTIGGRSGVSAADGTFSVAGVAYSGTTQNVFFGLQGKATKTGYFPGFFNPGSTSVGGVVSVGSVFMTPEGSTTPPPLPSNVSGSVSPNGGGATVEALVGTSIIRTTTANAAGTFTLWLPAGTYTVRATKGAQTGSTVLNVVNVNQVVSVSVTIN